MADRFGGARAGLFLSAAVGCIALAQPGWAQDTAPAPTAPEADAADDVPEAFGTDIVVRAQGRNQRLLDVPISVSAVTAESLEQTGASDIRELSQIAPSLQVSSTGSESNGSARVRGIGTVGDNPGLESSVAVFIDGVYRSRSGIGLGELGEIDSVEVLRGPQGTLFGRNASAGLINIRSKGPEFDFGANGEVSYGNFDYIRAQAGVTGPISDQLAARFDAIYVKRDGFYNDITNDDEVNNRDRYFLKGQLLFEPSDRLSFRLIADYMKRTEACCGAVYLDAATVPAVGNLLDEAYAGNGATFPASPNPAGNPIIDVLTDLGQPRASFSDPYSRDSYTSAGRGYGGRTIDWGVSLEGVMEIGAATLTSVTGYRNYDSSQGGDIDYSQLDLLYRAEDDGAARKFETFSQELRLQGSAFGEKLDWLIGGYFANEDLTVTDNLRFGEDYGRFAACRVVSGGSLAALYSPGSPNCLAPGIPVPGAVTAGLGILSSVANRTDSVDGRGSLGDTYFQTSRNFAAFTHNIVHITDKLDLTLGLRYTNELKRFNASFTNDNTACVSAQAAFTAAAQLTNGTESARFPLAVLRLACVGNSSAELNGISISDRRAEDEFTGTAVLSYKPTDDLLVYASFSRGYKAGGFNLDRSALKSPERSFASFGGGNSAAGAQALVGNLQFDSELVDAYEIGAKYGNGPFSIAISAFRQDFKNFQLNTFDGSVFLVQTVNGCSGGLAGGSGADSDQAEFDLGENYTGPNDYTGPNASLTIPPNGAGLTGRCSGDTGWGVRSEGVEVESTIRPHRDINVGLGLTYVETKYRTDLVGNELGDPLSPALRNLPGNNLSNAPEITVTSSFAWTPELGSSGLGLLFYVDQRTTSDYNTGSDLFEQKEQDGFTIVNARVGIGDADGRWGLEFWGKNIFNVNYTQVAFNSFAQASTYNANFNDATGFTGGRQIFSAYLAEPRTYGLTLRGRF